MKKDKKDRRPTFNKLTFCLIIFTNEHKWLD
ncbi:hypothetical protein SCAZ3_07950 [Streptococcus canis FSL Z3-227]|uniref:Transposase n=1 Tax=Streptococcus canis FSL Z3-227 TaxID=482234 RepID=A0AAV3FTL9_STRCB|nr:hypothetical protein SCAZ3_07950 [Streptococcus canis FSL Z3-227]